MIDPQYTWKFICPFTLFTRLTHSLDFSSLAFNFLKDRFVGDLYLVVRLRMIEREKMIGDGEVRVKQLEPVIVKLLCIIGDNYPWDPIQAYDIFSNIIPDVSFSDFG